MWNVFEYKKFFQFKYTLILLRQQCFYWKNNNSGGVFKILLLFPHMRNLLQIFHLSHKKNASQGCLFAFSFSLSPYNSITFSVVTHLHWPLSISFQSDDNGSKQYCNGNSHNLDSRPELSGKWQKNETNKKF